MLVLSRKRNEKLRIGDNIVITVCEIRDGSIRIGIEAPRELDVVRIDANGNDERKPQQQGDSSGSVPGNPAIAHPSG